MASVDASGNLSRFSQRADRVLAAPGERIMSTLPDHFYGGDGEKNDWGATSGTSMAAPYVAGASVLVREAMQNLGFTDDHTSVRSTSGSEHGRPGVRRGDQCQLPPGEPAAGPGFAGRRR